MGWKFALCQRAGCGLKISFGSSNYFLNLFASSDRATITPFKLSISEILINTVPIILITKLTSMSVFKLGWIIEPETSLKE